MLKQFTENEIWIQIQQLFLCPAEFEKDLEMSDDEEGGTGQSDADKCFRKTVKRKEKDIWIQLKLFSSQQSFPQQHKIE